MNTEKDRLEIIGENIGSAIEAILNFIIGVVVFLFCAALIVGGFVIIFYQDPYLGFGILSLLIGFVFLFIMVAKNKR